MHYNPRPSNLTDIERINALTTNARNTWFVLLAALVFVGLTLMSIEHIDFYGVDRATTLPLVNVEVPTRAFFIAAPILIAAIYSYFHLYLVRLWDALSTAPARIDNRPLGDVISPWLITDAALHMRTRRRKEYWSPTTHRVLESTAMWLNFAITWAFGLVVIGILWWLSMPARTFGLTLSAALSLFVMGFTGLTSFLMLRRRMKSDDIRNSGHIFRVAPGLIGVVFLCVPLVIVSYIRTEGEFVRLTDLFPILESHRELLIAIDTRVADVDPRGHVLSLAPLNLTGEQLVQRPQGWLPYAEAQKDYFAFWCEREDAPCKREDLDEKQEREFTNEWLVRRSAALGDLQKPYWNDVNADKPDLRDAIMPKAFLSGSLLAFAQMEGIDLHEANLEGADLNFANLEGADFTLANLEGAGLFQAEMEWAKLPEANLEGASLGFANLERANLSFANLEGANISGANLESANLSFSYLTGTKDRKGNLRYTNLSKSTNNGGMLRFLEMTEVTFDGRTDFRNAFLDGSVAITEALSIQLGDQCQSRLDVVLSDQEFYGRWLGWLQAHPNGPDFVFIAFNELPKELNDVDPIAPDPGCKWKPPLSEVEGVADTLDAGEN